MVTKISAYDFANDYEPIKAIGKGSFGEVMLYRNKYYLAATILQSYPFPFISCYIVVNGHFL